MKNLITLLSIKEFIIENALTDSVMLVLNSKNFDELALEYIESNNIQIERPFEILGICIIEDTDDEVAYNEIDILEVAYDHHEEFEYEYLRAAV